MTDRKLTSEELLQYSKAHLKVLHKYKGVSEQLDDYLYPFVTPRELKTIGKVLVKIKNKLNEENDDNE